MKQYNTGLNGERQAEEYLHQQGMTTLAHRYRGEDGEIDLIMLDNEVVVFVEVKARPHASLGTGLMAVTPAKQKRLTHAAAAFLLEREWNERLVRFDVVEINQHGIVHIPNAFMAVT